MSVSKSTAAAALAYVPEIKNERANKFEVFISDEEIWVPKMKSGRASHFWHV